MKTTKVKNFAPTSWKFCSNEQYRFLLCISLPFLTQIMISVGILESFCNYFFRNEACLGGLKSRLTIEYISKRPHKDKKWATAAPGTGVRC